MANKITGRRLYLLMPSSEPNTTSIWSNLSKLYDYLKEKKHPEILSYSSIRKKIQAHGIYEFDVSDEKYKILVKYVE